MNGDKAREMFSEYREGTLSASLRASLEQAMKSDSSLASDYSEFESLLQGLESTKDVTYEVPFDLHDKIMARVDKNLFEAKRNARPNWFSGWRLALVAGVAGVTIIGTVMSLKGPATGTAESGIASVNGVKGMEIVAKGNEVRLTHGPASTVIVVKDDANGDLAQRFDLAGKSLDSPLTNDRPWAVLLLIQSDSESSLLALPGSVRSTTLAGRGTLKDLAKAIADTSGQAVQLESKDPNAPASWVLDASDPSRSQATEGSFNIELRKGLVYLTD